MASGWLRSLVVSRVGFTGLSEASGGLGWAVIEDQFVV